MKTTLPPSVNFHLWQPCNMRCRFCFAGFEDSRALVPRGHLLEEDCARLNRLLARSFDKLGISLAPEPNEAMTGSYAMIDPAGRFFDNTGKRHTYSRPILEVGLEQAWSEIVFHAERFEARGGRYGWR